MIGTIINVILIIIGGLVGMFFGARLPDKMRQTIIAGLGLFTLAIGLQMFFKTANSIIVLGSMLFGGILGELWKIEDKLESLGGWLEKKFTSNNHQDEQGSRFIRGFMTASLLFCIGPIAILGAIQDGLSGDYKLLVIKSIMDGFASLAFASSLGVGVLFSSLMVLVYQGGITLLAGAVQTYVTTAMMNEMTAVGGLLICGLAFSTLLEIKRIRVGNFLPALFIAPLIVAILEALHIVIQ